MFKKAGITVCLSILLMLVGCSGKTETSLEHKAPNGKVTINITGKRATSVESWKVDMQVKAYSFKPGKLSFEIYAEDINNDNVKFDWVDEKHCKITFTQQDNSVRNFELIASSEQLQMAEM